MDYFGIFKDTVAKWWKHKYLWIVGIIGTLFGSGISYNNSYGNGDTTSKAYTSLTQSLSNLDTISIIIIILVVIIAIILAILGVYLSLRSTSGLIQATPKIDAGKTLSFKEVWTLGKNYLGNLFVQYLIVFIPTVVILLIFSASLFFTGISGMGATQNNALLVLVLLGVTGLICCIYFIFILGVSIIFPFSYRIAILENKGVMQSIKEAYYFVIGHLGDLVVFWLLDLLVGIVTWLILVPLILILYLFMFTVLLALMVSSPILFVIVTCLVILLFSLLSALINGPVRAFSNMYWTKVYLALKDKK